MQGGAQQKAGDRVAEGETDLIHVLAFWNVGDVTNYQKIWCGRLKPSDNILIGALCEGAVHKWGGGPEGVANKEFSLMEEGNVTL